MKHTKVELPTKYGIFDYHVFLIDNEEISVLTIGKIKDNMLTRIHSSCMTGDIFGSCKCDCGEQLDKSLKLLQKEKSGILFYLPQEGRGIGLFNKILAYQLQNKGYDTFKANNILGFEDDLRTYESVNKILEYFQIKKIRLLSNNPDKPKQLYVKSSLIPLVISANKHNKKYILAKKQKGHYQKNEE